MNKIDTSYIHHLLECFNKKGIVKSEFDWQKSFSIDRFNRALIIGDNFNRLDGGEMIIPEFDAMEIAKTMNKNDVKFACIHEGNNFIAYRMTDAFKHSTSDGIEFFIQTAEFKNNIWRTAEFKLHKNADTITLLNAKPVGQNDCQEYNRLFEATVHINIASFYEWHCLIKEDYQSRIFKFWCQPELLKEIFKFREKTGNRRKAIVNLIRNYHRQQNTSEGVRDVLIRQHLRGESSFEFEGMEISVAPSAYDLGRVKTKKVFESIT